MLENIKNRPSVLSSVGMYLSGAIEYGDNINWRIEPVKVLTEKFGINVFDPFSDPKQQWVNLLKESKEKRDYDSICRIAKDFVSKDLTMVSRSDFLVAYLPKGVPTTGTHNEIINSSNDKKPTLLICPQGKHEIPIWYFGWIPHTAMFGSWDELYEYLEEVNQYKHTHNRRWSYVYGLI